MKNLLLLLFICLVASCGSSKKNWVFEKEMKLPGISPIGIAVLEDEIWISDGDHNRLVEIDKSGTKTNVIKDFDRPMHIDANGGEMFVPEYGTDKILRLGEKERREVRVGTPLDAPAAFSKLGKEWLIADFYNHRIVYFNGENEMLIGKKGKGEGQFHYPTDVHLTKDALYVADAYNNRVQVFNKEGVFVNSIGANEKMDATTGVYVNDGQVYCTDFENDRVLVYSLEGDLVQILESSISQPTDAIINDDKLYIVNYKGESVSVFSM